MGFGGMENVRFRSPVHPGDRLVLVGKAVKLHPRQTIFNVQGFVGSHDGVPCRGPRRAADSPGGELSVRRRHRLPLEQLAPYLLPLPEPPRAAGLAGRLRQRPAH